MDAGNENRRVLAVGAHPDDIEFFCSGTLALLKETGYELHVATLTPGDCGSQEWSSEDISRIRRKEAAEACRLLGASYRCLEFRDFCILYSEEALRKVAGLVREVNPWLVLTHPPGDYMVDHEMTSRLVRTACFGAPAPNFEVTPPGAPSPDSGVPALLYGAPVEGIDILGNPVRPHFYVDVSDRIAQKEAFLACHGSQRNWLKAHHGIDEYLESLLRWDSSRAVVASKIAGRKIEFAEAFLQHRGHAYPAVNPLKRILGDRVIES